MADASTSEIRAFEAQDLRELRLLFGMSAMEVLAIANSKAYMHPMILAIWIALSAIFVQYMEWWPRPDFGLIGYLAPFPGFAAVAVPILFGIDWHHRPFFEKEIRRFFSREDILYLTQYYSSAHAPHSQFLVLVWTKRPIGYLAVDAAAPDEELSNLEDEERLPPPDEPSSKKKNAKNHDWSAVVQERERAIGAFRAKMTERLKKAKTKPPPDYAVIRHYHVDRLYASTGVQFDLIRKALGEVFSPAAPTPVAASASSSRKAKEKEKKKGNDAAASSAVMVNRLFIRISSLEPERERVFREVGFVPSKTRAPEGRAGLFLTLEGRSLSGEAWTWFEIDRARWEEGVQSIADAAEQEREKEK